MVYDADAEVPIYAAVTPARVNDITAAKKMPITAGATYVFDLGYYDYGWWAELDAKACRMSRAEINSPITVFETLPVSACAILSDRIEFLPSG